MILNELQTTAPYKRTGLNQIRWAPAGTFPFSCLEIELLSWKLTNCFWNIQNFCLRRFNLVISIIWPSFLYSFFFLKTHNLSSPKITAFIQYSYILFDMHDDQINHLKPIFNCCLSRRVILAFQSVLLNWSCGMYKSVMDLKLWNGGPTSPQLSKMGALGT